MVCFPVIMHDVFLLDRGDSLLCNLHWPHWFCIYCKVTCLDLSPSLILPSSRSQVPRECRWTEHVEFFLVILVTVFMSLICLAFIKDPDGYWVELLDKKILGDESHIAVYA
ncbi:hypothetical protein VNO80_24833 [Phaseolus coccineus]|uniref:Uncharacterized protein n=1 Tax=Phaseolus coccineus TaxID=3886 RepID=A0AAN9LTH3_PHACN